MNRTQSSNTAFLIVAFMLIESLFLKPASVQEKSIEWLSFEEAVRLAEENQQPIVVDVWAPWCGWCKKMQKEVYPNLSKSLSNQFVWTRLNRDDHESNLQYINQTFTPLRLAQKLNIQGVPALVFLSPDGEYMFHISGFIETQKLNSVLVNITSVKREKNLHERAHEY